MSIRLALLAFIVSLWGCGGHSLPTAPEKAVIRSTGNLQSGNLSPIVPVGSVRSKPAVINAGSTTEARNHEGNHPPIFNSSPHNLTLLLPRGPYPKALLKFNGEPATDPDGDNITYRFAFAVTGLSGIQTPSEALLRITREGNNFAFRGNGDITPAQFASVYGEDATIPTLLSGIYASDGTDESDPKGFNIHLVYDGSAQFSAPAEYIGDQRWEIPIPIEMYEGTTMLDTGQLPTWTAVTAEHRNWGFNWSPPRVRCEVTATTYDVYTFPGGGYDNTQFSLNSEERATSGTVSLTFKTVPDYETPGDSNIEGVTEDTYDIQVRANNSEGSGAWSSTIQAKKIKRTICFMASHYTAVEGDPSGAEIAVYLDPAAGALSITVPISVVEKEGAGPEDYSGVPSSITFAPGESMRVFSLMATEDSDNDEGTEKVQLNFGDLPKNVTPETPATAEVTLKEPIPVITRIRIISTPESGTTYGRGEIIKVEVTFNVPVVVTCDPYIWVKFDGNTAGRAIYKRGSRTERLVFEYCVGSRARDRNGIRIRSNALNLFGGSITAVSDGTDANINHAGLPDDPDHKVNGCL